MTQDWLNPEIMDRLYLEERVMDNDNLFTLIQDRMDPDEVVDLLGMGTGELCLRLRRQVLDNRERFEDYLGIYGDEE
jgi:hypothetical protein